jgi:MFS family permease
MNAPAYRRYLLVILLVIYAFNAMDGLALGLVMQNIKADLSLSDTELGTLSGIAFAMFYSVMGIPIARWADRGDRVAIISITLALWSTMVALCGFATNFTQLLLLRVGVAVGESGCIPPAHSLIADYFDRSERPRAVAIYMSGGALSVALGYFLAGWVNQYYGWRVTFFMLGAPGPILAVVAWLTLREPRRRGDRKEVPEPPAEKVELLKVWATLKSNRTFIHLLFGYSVASFFANGITNWQPAFFFRTYGLNTGELGTWFALIYGVGGMAGIYLGGEWASRRAAHNEPLQLRVMALMYCVFAMVSAMIYLSPSAYLAFGLMGLGFVGGATIAAPLFATIQTLVPERARATAIAIVFLFANLIGMGLGPLVSGALSDALRPWLGDESLRYALLLLSPGYLWSGWHLWLGSRTVSEDLSEACS